MNNTVFCIMGPTASGKTQLAIELYQHFPFEIISVDSALIYRGMTIGTAKPSSEELLKVPHHLIDIRNPNESYSAAEFCADAQSLCQNILKKGKIPLLVGGTMMYFNALQQGLSSLPEADPNIRKQIEQRAGTEGWMALHQELCQVDPKAGARIHSHDTQRIQRALEIYYLTGTSMSQIQSQSKACNDFQFQNILLFPHDRAWLHQRIGERFEAMLAQGFVQEVQQLVHQWKLDPALPSMRCVGYRQVLEYLQGQINAAQLPEKGIAATRQLAKRQLTWLRSWGSGLVFDPQSTTFIAEIVAKIQEILDNKTLYKIGPK